MDPTFCLEASLRGTANRRNILNGTKMLSDGTGTAVWFTALGTRLQTPRGSLYGALNPYRVPRGPCLRFPLDFDQTIVVGGHSARFAPLHKASRAHSYNYRWCAQRGRRLLGPEWPHQF